MAINPNNELSAKHCLYMAQTSSGKSTAINEQIKEEPRVIYWDPDEDYKAKKRFSSLSSFADYLVKHGGDKKLSVALSVSNVNKKTFDFFNNCVWLVANGKQETHVIWEELADVSDSSNLTDYAGQLVRKGRKYGIVIHAATQRPQNVAKILFSQCKRKWIGYQDKFDHAYIAANTGIEIADIEKIKPLEFITKEVNDINYGNFVYDNNKLTVKVGREKSVKTAAVIKKPPVRRRKVVKK